LSIGEIILAFWIAGVGLAMWKIWRPSYKIITLVDRNNILVTRPILSTIVVTVIFTIFLPFMVIPLLIPNRLEEFTLGFIRGAEKIK
jgi:hypothetical protein|tara:strand:+ start:113 stop:373 length:261 start_codon:yes stop_codon:yes gene_type:complete